MTRVIGYYLKCDGILIQRKKIETKSGALEEAKSKLLRKKAKTVGIVRAQDKLLLMTISLNKDNEFVTYVR